jgi:protein SCO1
VRPSTFALFFALLTVACAPQPAARQFELIGQVLAIRPDASEITIRHEAVTGFMPGMTMPFKVKDKSLLRGRLPGDLVRATLMVTDEEAWLSRIEKTGWAPFPDAPRPAAPAADLLGPGDPVPDETLIDQDGRPFRVSSLRGSAVLLTFVYTRCPLPDYCPRMDAWFGAVQNAVKAGRIRGLVRLLSVSFDPGHDTPAILREHAARVGADRAIWTYATAPQAPLDAWSARFGLSVIREARDPNDITHNLRTAVIDRQGRLVTILDGNRWTPEAAIAALASVPAP